MELSETLLFVLSSDCVVLNSGIIFSFLFCLTEVDWARSVYGPLRFLQYCVGSGGGMKQKSQS